MRAAELELMLAAVAWRLKASADDAGLTAAVLRDIARDGAMVLEQMGPALAATRQALARAQHGERREHHRAEHDSLTTLPNRRHFDDSLHDRLGATAPRARTLAVLFLDLDQFKRVNDHHGHDVGDALLRVVAKRLARTVRAGDVVCRLGGDEFACLLSGPMARPQISHLASKLHAAVSAPLKMRGVAFSVRPSIGIAVCPEDGDTAATLLQRADAAMFRAKRQQSGHAFFDAQADAGSGGRLSGR